MRFKFLAPITAAIVIAITIMATYAFDAVPAATAQTSTQLQTEINTLNQHLYLPLATWTTTYDDTLRVASDNQWMDWSQDECSAPLGGLGYASAFRMGCLRHDMTYRTLAVIDRATGRVWNERNRYRADKQILNDTSAYCTSRYGPLGRERTLASCGLASLAYYQAVRSFAGFRSSLSSEEDSVNDPDDSMYHAGMRLMAASNCSYSANSNNRCLPINYVERNGNPFAPQNLQIIPTGTAIEMQVVRANLQSVDGPPSSIRPQGIQPRPYDRTGELQISVNSPFVVGSTRHIGCTNQSASRILYADSTTYPVTTADTSLKRTTFYLKACSAVTASDLDDAMIELKPTEARRTRSGYVADMVDKRVRHYQNMNAKAPRASLSPRPDSSTLVGSGVWYGPLTLTTVSPLTSVRAVANPNDDTPLVEIASETTTSNHCSNGAETNDQRTVSSGDAIKIAMCGPGTGTLELRNPTTGHIVNTYVMEMAGSAPACSNRSIRSLPSTDSGNWSSADCESPYRTERYVDYFQLTPSTSQEVQIDLKSNTDAYLLVYRGTNIAGTPDYRNDDGGDGTNSRLTLNLTAGSTYTIGATTYTRGATGSYTLEIAGPSATQCSNTSISIPSTNSGRWSSRDCESPYRTGRYVDYFELTPSASQEVQIDLTSTIADTYLLVYTSTNTSGTPAYRDDDGGDGTNSQLTLNLVGGRTYTIGATTYTRGATGPYALKVATP